MGPLNGQNRILKLDKLSRPSITFIQEFKDEYYKLSQLAKGRGLHQCIKDYSYL